MPIHRWFGVTLGASGIGLCVAGAVGVCVYYPRLERKTVEMHATIDAALVRAGDRVDATRQRVETVSALAAELRATLKKRAVDGLLDRTRIGQRIDLVAARLQQARDGLDLVGSLLQSARGVQRLAHPLTNETDAGRIDGLLDELLSLHARVSSVVDSIDEVRRRVGASGDEAGLAKALELAGGEIVHAIDVVASVDDRLDQFSVRIGDARSRADDLKATIQRDLWLGRIAALVALAWMAVGQAAVCVLARRRGGGISRDG